MKKLGLLLASILMLSANAEVQHLQISKDVKVKTLRGNGTLEIKLRGNGLHKISISYPDSFSCRPSSETAAIGLDQSNGEIIVRKVDRKDFTQNLDGFVLSNDKKVPVYQTLACMRSYNTINAETTVKTVDNTVSTLTINLGPVAEQFIRSTKVSIETLGKPQACAIPEGCPTITGDVEIYKAFMASERLGGGVARADGSFTEMTAKVGVGMSCTHSRAVNQFGVSSSTFSCSMLGNNFKELYKNLNVAETNVELRPGSSDMYRYSKKVGRLECTKSLSKYTLPVEGYVHAPNYFCKMN